MSLSMLEKKPVAATKAPWSTEVSAEFERVLSQSTQAQSAHGFSVGLSQQARRSHGLSARIQPVMA